MAMVYVIDKDGKNIAESPLVADAPVPFVGCVFQVSTESGKFVGSLKNIVYNVLPGGVYSLDYIVQQSNQEDNPYKLAGVTG